MNSLDGAREQLIGERWLVAEEVAEILRISTANVYRLAVQGEIPSRKIGRRRRFPASRLAEWMRATQEPIP